MSTQQKAIGERHRELFIYLCLQYPFCQMFYRLSREGKVQHKGTQNEGQVFFLSWLYGPPTPFPLLLLSLFLFPPAPYCYFDKWQCKRIYVGSWRLPHYHKQNRALRPCRWGTIVKVFECDAWVKTHFWRSKDVVMPGQVWIKALGEPGEDTPGWTGSI